MSTKNIRKMVNRDTLRAFAISRYGTLKAFSKEYGLNYNSLRKFLAGDNTLTNLNRRAVEILIQNEVDPYGPTLPKLA
jgi:hypothetical protein